MAAHDSGRIINPRTALNQAEGAISQMLGFALSEELVTDEATGVTLNAGYLEHKSLTVLDYPDIQVIFADIVDTVGPLGAKDLGEVPTVGAAPAIATPSTTPPASASAAPPSPPTGCWRRCSPFKHGAPRQYN